MVARSLTNRAHVAKYLVSSLQADIEPLHAVQSLYGSLISTVTVPPIVTLCRLALSLRAASIYIVLFDLCRA